jgi:hypothetical protein
MTPKQKLKSIEKKMQRIQDQENIDIDLNDACKHFFDIERYFRLRQEHFILKFELEHCNTCGKKL